MFRKLDDDWGFEEEGPIDCPWMMKEKSKII